MSRSSHRIAAFLDAFLIPLFQIRRSRGHCRPGHPPTVAEVLESRVLLAADLLAENVSLNRSSAAPGDSVTVTFTMRNQGGSSAGQSVTRFRLSQSASGSSLSDPVLTDVTTPALSAGQSVSLSTTVTVPSNTASGTFYVWAITDNFSAVSQSNTGNDFTRSSALTVAAAASRADLLAENVSLNRSSAAPGDSVTVTVTIRNQGGSAAGQSVTRFRLSQSASGSSLSDPVLTDVTTPSLSAGQSASLSTTVTVPSNTTSGTFYVWAITDNFSAVSQSNTGNDFARSSALTVATAASRADLIAENVLLSRSSAAPGDSVTVNFTMRNQGGSPAGQSVTRFRLSQSASGSNLSDPVLTDVTTPSLSTGQSVSLSTTVTVPSNTASGAFYVWAITDNFSAVSQSNTGNDFARSSAVTVRPTPQVPAAPTNLAAVSTSATRIELNWQDNSGNESGFQIERKTGETGRWSRIATTRPNVSGYSNTGLTTDTTYSYRVRAVNSVGSSAYSAEVTAIPAAIGDSFENDNSPDVATTIATNGTTQVHSIHRPSDVDWVKFTLTQTSLVTIETSGSRGNTRLWLYGSNGVSDQIAYDDNGGAGDFSKIVRIGGNALGAGTYFVKVDDNNNNSTIDSYSVSVNATALELRAVSLATASGMIHDWIPRSDGSIVGTVTTNGTETDDGYSFVSGLNGKTTIQVIPNGRRSSLDAIIVVRDMAGATVARINGTRGARAEVGDVWMESGRRYEINIFGDRGTRGEYRLTIKQDSTFNSFNPAEDFLANLDSAMHVTEVAGQLIQPSLINNVLGAADEFGWSAEQTQRVSAVAHRVEDQLEALGEIGDVLSGINFAVVVGRILTIGGSGYQIEAWNRLIYSILETASGSFGGTIGGIIGTSVLPFVGTAAGGLIGSEFVSYLVTNAYDAFGRDAWIELGVEVFGAGA